MYHHILLTGASGGIGRELAHFFAKEGIKQTLVVRKKSEELINLPHVTLFEADLASVDDRSRLLDYIFKTAPDLVINNAGFGLYGSASSLSLEEQKKMIDVNIVAVMEITLAAISALEKEKKKGVILNVSSAASAYPAPFMSVYAASKAFVSSFSQGVDYECREKNIRILVSEPGQVYTDFATKAAGKKIKRNAAQMEVSFAAASIVWQIKKQRGVYLFDWRYRLIHFLTYLIPTSLIKHIIANETRNRL